MFPSKQMRCIVFSQFAHASVFLYLRNYRFLLGCFLFILANLVTYNTKTIQQGYAPWKPDILNQRNVVAQYAQWNYYGLSVRENSPLCSKHRSGRSSWCGLIAAKLLHGFHLIFVVVLLVSFNDTLLFFKFVFSKFCPHRCGATVSCMWRRGTTKHTFY